MKDNMTMERRKFLAAGVGVPVVASLPLAACSKSEPANDADAANAEDGIINPLILQRADPWVYLKDGYYYFTASVPEYDRVILRRSKTVAGLSDAEERVLWRAPKSGRMSGNVWAPEVHYFGGKWNIYFAAGEGDGEDPFRIRTYVLQAEGDDPMKDDWSMIGQLKTPWDSFTLDATSFEHKGTRYLCWAQKEDGIDTNSNLYLAPLDTPLTFAAEPVRLSVPTLPWEIQGYKVNEGAAYLNRNGKVFLTYSASATDARYCMGMLTADENADLMDPESWTKSQEPVFQTSEENKVYGPGHNSFTVDQQGRDILIYHARNYKEIKGDPLFDPNRHTRAQLIHYREDGTPDFGVPVKNGPMPKG